MPIDALKIVFERGALTPAATLRALMPLIQSAMQREELELYGEPMTLGEAIGRLENGKKRSANVVSERLRFQFASAGSCEFDFAKVELADPGQWDPWVQPFIQHPSFVMAWAYDTDYDYWQNASDPAQYVSAGRGYSHLRLTPNGHPPPFAKDIIDISQHPGRVVLRSGYVEAVGGVMWLARAFWDRSGSQQSEALAMQWLNPSEPAQGVLRIQPVDDLFRDESNAAVQDQMRSLLFPHRN